jgi:excisionase family DNA binding protein
LTLQDVAELLEVSPNTIYYWRYQGTGPKGHKVGKRVRYWRSEVLDWLQGRADLVSGLSPLPRR